MPILPVVALATALAAAPSDLDARLDAAIAAAVPAATADRRQIHQHPELGYEELETSKLVATRLRALGFDEVRTGIAETGVIGILRGGLPGPIVGLRADMDALPVTEATDLPFRSLERQTYLGQEVGVAHACGHDVHTSSMLGTAAALAAVRDAIPGTLVFIFQPDEEGPPPGKVQGAKAMMDAGALADPKPALILALHSFTEWDAGQPATVGQVGVTSGPTYAAVDQFEIVLHGKQSHGAYPNLGVDPVVMAAQAIMALQTIRSRVLPPREPSVLTIGKIHGGERFNIIPGDVRMEGTVRTYSVETQTEIESRMRQILAGVTAAAGGTYELTYTKNAPAVINDPSWAARLRPALERAVGAANVIDAPPTMGGEDFSFLIAEIPGFYYRLGVVAPGTKSGGLHTPDFRADDSAVAVGIRSMAHLAVDALRLLAEPGS